MFCFRNYSFRSVLLKSLVEISGDLQDYQEAKHLKETFETPFWRAGEFKIIKSNQLEDSIISHHILKLLHKVAKNLIKKSLDLVLWTTYSL